MKDYTRKMASYCVSLDHQKIPVKVVEIIKWCIYDNLGIILGATKTDFGKLMIEYAESLRDNAEATVLGSNVRTSARTAALVNGSLSEALELQDGYSKGGMHPCCPVISTSLAIAEWQGKTGSEFINAVLAGYEIGNRVAASIFPSHMSKGVQPTGTVGTIGAAAAAAKLLGLDEEQTYNAFGIAGFILPISTNDNLWGGYSIKPIHGGTPARAGIEAVLLAMRGLKGAPLEGDPRIGKGFLRLLSDKVNFEKSTQGIGEEYTISDLYFKPYALCRVIHSPVEIAINLRKQYGISVEDIMEVEVRTYDFAAQVPGQNRTNVMSEPTQCQFSLPYGVAAALMYGKVGLEEMMGSTIRDPKIHDLANKVSVVHSPEMDKLRPHNRPAAVEVTLKDGRKVSGYVDYPKGDLRKPMTESELETKFMQLTIDVIGKDNVEMVQERVFNLDKLSAVNDLIQYLK
ncbi:MAG: MmgE/PrpD family protein [Candidatus Theseobacter exili]|nr:MmgE/PrpD family protein [Candidatus Theseobacter exili]